MISACVLCECESKETLTSRGQRQEHLGLSQYCKMLRVHEFARKRLDSVQCFVVIGDHNVFFLLFNEQILVERESSTRVEHVLALCTHRPWLRPIGGQIGWRGTSVE